MVFVARLRSALAVAQRKDSDVDLFYVSSLSSFASACVRLRIGSAVALIRRSFSTNGTDAEFLQKKLYSTIIYIFVQENTFYWIF